MAVAAAVAVAVAAAAAAAVAGVGAVVPRGGSVWRNTRRGGGGGVTPEGGMGKPCGGARSEGCAAPPRWLSPPRGGGEGRTDRELCADGRGGGEVRTPAGVRGALAGW